MRVGIISDIHANLLALDAALAALRCVGVDRIVCCGDVVGCGPWPAETIDRLKEENVLSVRGNHDDAVLHVGRYRAAGDEAALHMLAWTEAQLASDHREYLEALPERLEDGPITIAHGSLRAPLAEFVIELGDASDCFDLLDNWIGLLGHSHIQAGFEHSQDGVRLLDTTQHDQRLDPQSKYLINPGSVGMPRDGDPTAAYAWLDLDVGSLTYRHAPYAAATVAAAIRDLGFDEVCPSSLLEIS